MIDVLDTKTQKLMRGMATADALCLSGFCTAFDNRIFALACTTVERIVAALGAYRLSSRYIALRTEG